LDKNGKKRHKKANKDTSRKAYRQKEELYNLLIIKLLLMVHPKGLEPSRHCWHKHLKLELNQL